MSLEGAAKFLIDGGYHRLTKSKRQPRAITPKISAIGKMFRNPFYYGILVQSNQTVDLRQVYDFQSMIDEQTFNQVQLLSYGRTKDKFTSKRVTFYPLHDFVFCAVCKQP